MINIKQCALTTFKQHRLALGKRCVEQERSVSHVRTQDLGVFEQGVDNRVGVNRTHVVDLDQHLVLMRERTFDFLPQDARIKDVLHTDAQTRDLVAVRRPDATASRADLRVAEESLDRLIECHVIRRNEMRVGADEQLAGLDPALFKSSEFA